MLSDSNKINVPHHQSSSHRQQWHNIQNTNESSPFKAPYFNADIQSKVVERAKKQNLIREQRVQECSGKAAKVDHLGKASKIVQQLIKKQGLAKQKINRLKEQMNKQNQKQCSFKPQNVTSQRYIFKGNIIQRNQIWLEQKKRKEIQRKQEALVSDLDQCTFSPQISSRKVSQKYLKNKSKVLTNNSEHSQNKYSKPSCPQTPSPIKNKKDISMTQFQTAKKQIKSRLYTIPLRN